MLNEEFQKTHLIAHLIELKTRLIRVFIFFCVAFAVCYYFSENIYIFLAKPLADAMGKNQHDMIYTSLTEAFFTYVKLALFGAVFLTFPMIAVQVYYFLSPGLYKSERALLVPLLTASPFLFTAGAAFVYYVIMPLAWRFFLSFETNGGSALPITLAAKVSEYLSLVTHLMFGFGLSFQLPIVLIIMAQLGIIEAAHLKKNRRYAVLAIVIIAAILTPPDVISQLGLASVLYALYELAIIGCVVVGKRKGIDARH